MVARIDELDRVIHVLHRDQWEHGREEFLVHQAVTAVSLDHQWIHDVRSRIALLLPEYDFSMTLVDQALHPLEMPLIYDPCVFLVVECIAIGVREELLEDLFQSLEQSWLGRLRTENVIGRNASLSSIRQFAP